MENVIPSVPLSLRAVVDGVAISSCHTDRAIASGAYLLASEAWQSLIPARDSHATLRFAQNDRKEEKWFRSE